MTAISPEQIELDPLEIDPRPCEWCGLTIDQHRMVDTGEGPEFFCEEIELQNQREANDIIGMWELADPRDRWRHTGEPPPPVSARNSDIFPKPTNALRPYSTPQATVDAFLYVARNESTEYVARWLKKHPLDAPVLQKIWKAKCTARST
jgi:hypothetical protein